MKAGYISGGVGETTHTAIWMKCRGRNVAAASVSPGGVAEHMGLKKLKPVMYASNYNGLFSSSASYRIFIYVLRNLLHKVVLHMSGKVYVKF